MAILLLVYTSMGLGDLFKMYDDSELVYTEIPPCLRVVYNISVDMQRVAIGL